MINPQHVHTKLHTHYIYIHTYIHTHTYTHTHTYITRQFMFDFTDWSGARNIHSQRTQLLSPSDRWRWCSYSYTFTGGVGVLAVRRVHTFTLQRLSASLTYGVQYQAVSTCTCAQKISYWVFNLSLSLSLIVMTNSDTKSIWRQQPHNSHYRETIPQQTRSMHQPGTSRVHCELSDVLPIRSVNTKSLCSNTVHRLAHILSTGMDVGVVITRSLPWH
jgi:hypothetical protein